MAEKKKAVYRNDVYFGKTKPVRVMFKPALAEARKVDGRGDAKFEVQVGFEKDHPDVLPLKKLMAEMAREKWGPNVDLKKLRLKFVDGDEEYKLAAEHPTKPKEYPHLKGLTLLKLRSKNPISVFNVRERDPRGVPVALTDKEKIARVIYGGSYVALKFTLMTYDEIVDQRDPSRSQPPGITIFPEQVVFVADGERLGGGSKDDGSGFASLQGAESAEDPAGDDEIPF